jgi:hypothetical protein
MTGATTAPRVAVAALLILLAPLGGHLETLPLSIVVTALLTVLAGWELRSARLDRRHQPEEEYTKGVPHVLRSMPRCETGRVSGGESLERKWAH